MTIYDVITVACFMGLAYFYFSRPRDLATLSKILLSMVLLAVANQLGNRGLTEFAVLLIVASAAYAALVFRESD
jgi:hypothetical protein